MTEPISDADLAAIEHWLEGLPALRAPYRVEGDGRLYMLFAHAPADLARLARLVDEVRRLREERDGLRLAMERSGECPTAWTDTLDEVERLREEVRTLTVERDDIDVTAAVEAERRKRADKSWQSWEEDAKRLQAENERLYQGEEASVVLVEEMLAEIERLRAGIVETEQSCAAMRDALESIDLALRGEDMIDGPTIIAQALASNAGRQTLEEMKRLREWICVVESKAAEILEENGRLRKACQCFEKASEIAGKEADAAKERCLDLETGIAGAEDLLCDLDVHCQAWRDKRLTWRNLWGKG